MIRWMRKKRILPILLVLAMTVSVLSACGKAGAETAAPREFDS